MLTVIILLVLAVGLIALSFTIDHEPTESTLIVSASVCFVLVLAVLVFGVWLA